MTIQCDFSDRKGILPVNRAAHKMLVVVLRRMADELPGNPHSNPSKKWDDLIALTYAFNAWVGMGIVRVSNPALLALVVRRSDRVNITHEAATCHQLS
jgi:hypothetical protein